MLAFWTTLLSTTSMIPYSLIGPPPAQQIGETVDSTTITADTTTTTADEF